MSGKKKVVINVYREIKFTTKSFKNIAVENNFSSQAHFNRFCKKQYGNTPKELRNFYDNNKLY
ncbi:helix-turn-helix domain-containing protein [Macellibacteroides fermentans]|uniref:helix-turn-helix domain-containing protein n=1 Tax=Macellibacteroides fermentans TaxID=879969 RepID=UPI00406C68EE